MYDKLASKMCIEFKLSNSSNNIYTLTGVNFCCLDPQTWTKEQVAKWITRFCNVSGTNEAEVSMFKTLSGAERGGMLLEMWNLRVENSQERQLVTDDTSKPPLASVIKRKFFKNR